MVPRNVLSVSKQRGRVCFEQVICIQVRSTARETNIEGSGGRLTDIRRQKKKHTMQDVKRILFWLREHCATSIFGLLPLLLVLILLFSTHDDLPVRQKEKTEKNRKAYLRALF